MGIDPVFALAAAVSVVSGLMTVTRRNPVYSAVWMLACFIALAVVYLRLDAPFLAAMHVLVYTGAILVLFLFVIMLLNLKPEEFPPEPSLPAKGVCALLCLGLFGLLAVPMWFAAVELQGGTIDAKGPAFGGVEYVGEALFGPYALPFELMSVLIMVAIFGGVVLARRKAA